MRRQQPSVELNETFASLPSGNVPSLESTTLSPT